MNQKNLTKEGCEGRFNLKRLALTLGGTLFLLCSSAQASEVNDEGFVGSLKAIEEAPQQQQQMTEPEISAQEKALLETEDVKLWSQQCDAGKYSYCGLLAQVFLDQKMYERASTYLEKVCYSNSPEANTACAGLTSLLSFEEYDVMNLKKAQEVARHLCDTKSVPFGCLALSQLYLRPEFKDPNSSFDYAQKACELNDATGCKQVALTIYSQAFGQKDIYKAQQAFEFYKKACELGDEDSCKTYEPHAEKLKQFQLYVERSNEQASQPVATE